MSHRMKYDKNRDFIEGFGIPCMCPLHELFKPLQTKFFPENKGPTWSYECKTNLYVFKDRHGLKQHCDQQKHCWRHEMLSEYLDRLYPFKKSNNKNSRRKVIK